MKTRSKEGVKKVTNKRVLIGRNRCGKSVFNLTPSNIDRMERKIEKLKTSLEPTYWETASYAAIAVGGAVLVVTAILISILTFG